MPPVRRVVLPVLALAVFWGCDAAGPETAPRAPVASVELDGYTVDFLGTLDAPGGTTFRYRVAGSGDVANLNYVFLETACDAPPTALDPSNAVSIQTNSDADTVLTGAQWEQGLGEDGSRDYALTFAEAELGLVTVVIRSGNTVQSALVPGACGNLFSLRGSVFVNDGDDASPAREPNELGVASVRVDALDADGVVVASQLTDAEGRYHFRLVRGAYTVRVTPDESADAFNPTLFTSYAPVADVTERAVSLTDDVGGADFGFDAIKEVIVVQVGEGGTYQTIGEPVRVWKRWVSRAQRERRCKADDPSTECRAALAGYLDAIFATGAPDDVFVGNADPYRLAPGADPFEAALAILGAKPKATEDKLYQEVFAMELNWLSGRGSADPLYDRTLIYAFEETLGLGPQAAAVRAAGAGTAGAAAAAVSSIDVEIATRFNGGGGGGEVGEN